MLEEIERGAPAFVDGDNLTVKQRIDWEAFAGAGDTGELRREEVTPTRPEGYSAFVPASRAAVPVKLDVVEPFLALEDFRNSKGVHWLDEIDSGGVSSSCFHLGIV